MLGGGTGGSNETLHWDGGQMLFATRKLNGQDVLDDIKIDAQGDVLPQDQGYQGLTFFDRGPGGAVMGCHNGLGAVYAGNLGDVWVRGWGFAAQDDSPCYQENGPAMPTSIDWYGTPLITGTRLGAPIGKGGVLGMPRPDGLTDNEDTLQGVRTYDSTAGTWTTPDAYSGDVHDPGSQKSYMWNGNNPVAYSDPTGFDEEFQSQEGSNAQSMFTDYYAGDPGSLQAVPNSKLQQQEQQQRQQQSYTPLTNEEIAMGEMDAAYGITSGFSSPEVAAFVAGRLYNESSWNERGTVIYSSGNTYGFVPLPAVAGPKGGWGNPDYDVTIQKQAAIELGGTPIAVWHAHGWVDPLLTEKESLLNHVGNMATPDHAWIQAIYTSMPNGNLWVQWRPNNEQLLFGHYYDD
jgi:RHS repeat-associated protein